MHMEYIFHSRNKYFHASDSVTLLGFSNVSRSCSYVTSSRVDILCIDTWTLKAATSSLYLHATFELVMNDVLQSPT